MSRIITNNNSPKFVSKLKAMSPYEVYLSQIRGMIDTIRYSAMGMEYIPPQMGGVNGQRQVIEQGLVLQNIEFEVKE